MGILPEVMRRVGVSCIHASRIYRPLPLICTTNNAKTSFSITRLCSSKSNRDNTSGDKLNDRIDKFIDPEVQRLLKSLTGRDYNIIFRRRKVGDKMHEPTYSFMTAEQLESALDDANSRAEEILQIPPVLRARKPIDKVISFDPCLQGLEKVGVTLLFTDISQEISDLDRLIVARDSDGTLRHASWEERHKANSIYFPTTGKSVYPPRMFRDPELLQQVLARASEEDNTYVFALDLGCMQFDPDDPAFISLLETIYEAVDSKNHYELLRSTRHYGGMVFYLVRLRKMDKLLCSYLDQSRIKDASDLISLFSILFTESKSAQAKITDDLEKIKKYIESDAVMSAQLKLHLNNYLEGEQAKEDLHKGLEKAHGF